jgi:hypothetical protein
MSKSPRKQPKRGLSWRQKAAVKHLLEKGGSVGDAMRHAGYTPATAKNPSHLTKSKGFVKILEKAGLTDEVLAQGHMELMQSSRIEHQSFPAIYRTTVVDKDENGKKLKKALKEEVYRHVPDNVIKMQIESVPGHKLMYIQKGTVEKIAYIKVPENIVRKSAIEMGYKVKAHFAPDKLDIVDHELSDEDRALLLSLNVKSN